MAVFIALLRGINVGGKSIKMEALRKSCGELGFKNVRSYIQSGNLVFSAPQSTCVKVAQTIQNMILEEFNLEVSVLVKLPKEIRSTLNVNPFLKKKGIDLARLHVTFLSQKPSREALEKLARVESAQDEFASIGKEIYLRCPQGYGNTKLSNQAIERILGFDATTRNWKTVNELLKIADI